MWKSEDSLWALVLSFHCADSGNWIQLISTGTSARWAISLVPHLVFWDSLSLAENSPKQVSLDGPWVSMKDFSVFIFPELAYQANATTGGILGGFWELNLGRHCLHDNPLTNSIFPVLQFLPPSIYLVDVGDGEFLQAFPLLKLQECTHASNGLTSCFFLAIGIYAFREFSGVGNVLRTRKIA